MIDILNKIMRYTEKIPCDKRIHFIVGSVIAVALMLFNLEPIVILIIVSLIGYLVEVYQYTTKSGSYDIKDAIAVALGGLLPLVPEIIKGV